MEKRTNIGGKSSTLKTHSKYKNDGARRTTLLLAAASGLSALAAASQGYAQITVANPNFANPVLASGTDGGNGNVPGWTVYNGYGAVLNPSAAQFPQGVLSGNLLTLNTGTTYQNLGTMVVGTTYTFDISYGWRSDIPQYESNQFVFILRPNLFSSNAFVVSKSANFSQGYPTADSVTSAPLPSGTGTLVTDVLSYTATAADNGQPLTLQLQAQDLQLCIADVALTSSAAPVDPNQLFYTGAASGSFDTTTPNNFALANGSSTAFVSNRNQTVTFNDTSIVNGSNISNTSVVIQAGGVLPAAVNVATNSVNYTFTDQNGVGIGGSASLTKTGTSTLYLAGSNSYTGGSTISGGTVNVGINSALGTGPINFPDTATLQAGAASVTLSNNINMGAGTTTIDTNGNVLTLTGSIVNSPNLQLPVPNLSVIGTGTLNLAGTLNINSGTTNDNDPALYLSANGTTVNITGTGSLSAVSMGWLGSTNTLILNPGSGTGVLNLTSTDGPLDVGQQGGQGAVYQTGGTVNLTGNFNLARWDSSYGSYTMTGGTLNVSNLNVGAYGSGGTLYGGNCNAYLTQSNGTINVGGNTVLVSQNAGNAVTYLTGGVYNNSAGSVIVGQGSGSNASLTVAQNASFTAGAIVLSGSANSSILTLNGGTTTTGSIVGGSSSILNLNGGVLAVNGSGGTITNFLSGVGTAKVYAGGAIIDSGTNNITVSQNLSSAVGSGGLNGAPVVSSGGTGYISPPIVFIAGSGYGATAVATVSNGAVTGVTITNPGLNYTGTPTFTFLGGGGSGAAVNVPAATPNVGVGASNTDGGLIKRGSGTLTLSGSNTYTGPTRITAGTLQVAAPGPSVTVPNANFENPALAAGSFQYSPSDTAWNYYSPANGAAAGAGLLTNNAPFATNGAIPGSTQAAFLQGAGGVFQNIDFPSNGVYTLSFYTEQRAGYTGQQLNVAIGGNLVPNSTITPPSSWTLESIQFTASQGSQQLLIEGANTNGDNTAYITDVSLTAPYVGGSVTSAIPSVSPVILSAGATLDVNSSIQTVGSLNGPSGSFITLESGTLIVGGDGTNATFAGNISDGGLGGGLAKIGSGVQTLTGPSNSYTGSTNISGGTLILGVHGALPSGTPVVIGQGALLVADSQSTIGSVSSLNLNGNLIVHNGSISALTSAVAAGYNGGNWNGSTSGAISSTAAASDTAHLSAVGVILNTRNGSAGAPALYSSFEGQNVTNSDVLLKYTYYGDTDLSGSVDGSDYSRVDVSYTAEHFVNGVPTTHVSGWFNGDFNYDGVVDGSDYTLIDNAFNSQGAAFSAEVATATDQIGGTQLGGSSAVPEPASVTLMAIGAAGLLGRRRRSM
jgi:autotransporter-associated beta strand protein